MDDLADENRRLREALAAMRGLVSNAWYRVGPDWRIVEANARFEALAGRPLSELAGRRLWEIYPETAHDKVATVAEAVRRDGQPRSLEAYSPAFRRWIKLTVAPAQDGGFEFFLDDRDETKRGETLLRSVLEANTDCLKLVELDGRLSLMNANGLCQLGFGAACDVEGRLWAELWPEPGRTQVEAALAAARDGASSRFEGFCPTARGEPRWWDVAVSPVRGPDGAVALVVAVSRDVTESRAAAAALRQLNEALEARVEAEVAARELAQSRLAQAQKMEALGQLAGGVAHDFNNVLQAVQGAAALIGRRPGDRDRVAHLARLVLDAAARGAAVTRRLLAFSRRGELRATMVDARGVLLDLREVLAHTLGAGIQVRVEAPDDLPPLRADKGQLETVLVNLATNARDAMPRGGTVLISASLAEAGCGPAAGDPCVSLRVVDTGVGMDSATLTRASEPFFTTKPVGRGTGLGLAMARGFAEQSGGALRIASAPGEGTTVELLLPAALGAVAAEDAFSDGGAATAGPSRGRVLLVDDDPLVREALAAQLEAAGYAVLPAAHGGEALDRLAADEEVVDLLVSDLAMPGMPGPAVIEAARRLRPGLPAILLTGYAGDALMRAAGAAPRDTYSLLRKPVDGALLVERVALLMEDAAAGRDAG
jgi:PAS domain S-box-containing protein